MSKFKVGDVVRGVTDNYLVTNKDMKRAVVIGTTKDGLSLKILEHKNKKREGEVYGELFSSLPEKDFALVNETIVIYRKDRRVIALDKATGNKAIARCNPSDEFDFNTGAKLAFERLMDSEPKNNAGLNEDAKKLYEVYKSLTDAGFTSTEAMQLVVNMLLGGKK